MTTLNDTLHGLCKNEPHCILDGFYGALNALDLTASAVLIFAGTLIVAAAHAAHRPGVTNEERKWALIVMLLSLVAAGLCLRVAQISYPFHGFVVGPQENQNYDLEFKHLDYEVWLRTCLFWAATLLSVAAVVIPLVRSPFEIFSRGAAWLFVAVVIVLLVLWAGEFFYTNVMHVPK